MLPRLEQQPDLDRSVRRRRGSGSELASTVAVVVEHGANGRADGEAASLDKG